jgi:hypothetical protein
MKYNYITAIIGLLCLGGTFLGLNAQGMVVNEFSNGASGTREYMEFVVVGPVANPNCGPVDLRGWIIDDNNGDFSCGPCSGTGIASGHLRLASVSSWEAVPTGSIIVVYNDDAANTNPNIPAADPDDTSPADGVYVVPVSSSVMEVSTGSSCPGGNIPFGSTSCPGPCTGDPTYASACYTLGGSWANAGMRNSGDAAQVRQPDGSYFHGVAYGSGMNGGPDNLYISGSGSGQFFMFDNSTNDDFRTASNWSSQAVSSNNETPGAPNNADNAAWISDLSTPCPLPVVYAGELSGYSGPAGNVLTWSTAVEVNTDKFVIEKTSDLNVEFQAFAELDARGNSSRENAYELIDPSPTATTWYRLRQVDQDGQENVSRIVKLVNQHVGGIVVETFPNPAGDRLNFRIEGATLLGARLMDMSGRVVRELPASGAEGAFDTRDLRDGVYMLQVRTATGVATRRVVCQH